MVSDKKSLLGHEALLILLIPLLGYAISFLYEIGYCNTFNIPSYFIRPSTTTIFIGISSIVLFLLLYFVIRWGFEIFLGTGPISLGIKNLAMPLLILIYYFGIFGADWKRLGGVIAGLAIVVFMQFGVPFLTQSKRLAYGDKVKAQDKADWESDKFRRKITEYFGPGLMHFFVLLGFVFWAAYVTGGAHAEQQREFLVSDTEPKIVVLRNYANEFICSTFNETTKELLNEFTFLNRDNLDQTLSFKLRMVGPLKPVEIK